MAPDRLRGEPGFRLALRVSKRVVELWDYDGKEKEPPYFGWLCTRLLLYPDTGLLKTHVHLRLIEPTALSSNWSRPIIRSPSSNAPGITMARVREIAAANLVAPRRGIGDSEGEHKKTDGTQKAPVHKTIPLRNATVTVYTSSNRR